MIIWAISDTHGYHEQLEIPSGIDMIIHSGDCSNNINPYFNQNEVRQFIEWYKEVPVKHKIYVAGNHDTSIEKKLVTKKDFEDAGIIYLEDDVVEIEGLYIYGNPYTPKYGNWAFMKTPEKLNRYWREVRPIYTDILVTHGPPKGILDKSYNRSREIDQCGDKNLLNMVKELKPKLVCFGHIHSNKDIQNNGILYQNNIYFSNGSVVKDREFGKLYSNGNIFEIDDNQNVKIY